MEARRFRELSHGEQRKVLLARALIQQPRLLVLDEPCSGLDVPTREDFLLQLEAVAMRSQRLLLVTHHIEEIPRVVSHVLLMDHGRVITAGRKSVVLGDGRLSQVMGFPFRLVEHEGRYWPWRGGRP
jgi:iron complex transport system ATP-binding protein